MRTLPTKPVSDHAILGTARGPLAGKTILIVEDEPLIALDLHAALRAAGAGLVAATTTPEALSLIRRNEIAAAIVDVALAKGDCREVCQALFHRSIPFLFYTGHRDAAVLKEWPEAPVLEKPKRHEDVVAAIIRIAHT
jgi:DNA-binding response OmpR family regulator